LFESAKKKLSPSSLLAGKRNTPPKKRKKCDNFFLIAMERELEDDPFIQSILASIGLFPCASDDGAHHHAAAPSSPPVETKNNDTAKLRARLRNDILYKTQLCRSWRCDTGCPYANKCRFRHPNESPRIRPSEHEIQRILDAAVQRPHA
jgi:hypothetical protein